MDIRRYMGYAWGRSSAGSGGNTFSNDLYRDMAGNCGTVGGVTTDIRSVCRVEGLRGGWTQEGGLVAPRGDREKLWDTLEVVSREAKRRRIQVERVTQ